MRGLLGYENVLYLDLGLRYIDVLICEISLCCTLKVCVVYYMWILYLVLKG